MSNYEINVISHHPQFANKSLRKYHVDGIDTVGAWGNEPFEVRFKNNTWQKIQVRISIDGTDVFTGKPATTDTSGKMWVVNGYGTLSLKAWPEDNNGGASFVFTNAGNSVAIHTHGDLSSRGIIAAAVFVEGHVEPIYYHPIVVQPLYPVYPTYPYYDGITWGGGSTYTSGTTSSDGRGTTLGNAGGNTISTQSCVMNNSAGSASMDSLFLDNNIKENTSGPLETLVAVGAGQHVDQKINYVAGLIKPIFNETVRVRYIWWDDLTASLRKNNVPAPHASGFPGNPQGNINLGNTPRLPTGSFKRAEQPVVYSRV